MAKRKNDEFWLNNYLQNDEEWQWIGKPDAWRLFTWGDLFLIPFSLFWCAIAYTLLFSMLFGLGFLGLGAFLIPHVWVAIWLFPGRFIYEHLARKNTTYVVTNRRLLIMNTLFGNRCKSYYIHDLPEIDIHSRGNNTGTIKFSGKPQFSSTHNWNRSGAQSDFFDIPDVWDVYHLIQELHFEAQLIYEEVEYYDDSYAYEYDKVPRKRHARG